MKKTVYLSLGSNLGNRGENLRQAIRKLRELGQVAAISSFYETEPVEMEMAEVQIEVQIKDQPWFLNCAVALETELMPRQLMQAVLRLERALGRRRRGPLKLPRAIDIDILLFGAAIIESKGLTVPHPRMHERRFVLEPMAEIAPEARHPLIKKTMRELKQALAAGSAVRRINESNVGGGRSQR